LPTCWEWMTCSLPSWLAGMRRWYRQPKRLQCQCQKQTNICQTERHAYV